MVRTEEARAPGVAWPLVVFLAPPVVWFAHLSISYATQSLLCAAGASEGWIDLVLVVLAVAAGALVVASTWFAYRVRYDNEQRAPQAGRAVPRNEYLGTGGLLLGGIFLLAIVLAGIVGPLAIADSC